MTLPDTTVEASTAHSSRQDNKVRNHPFISRIVTSASLSSNTLQSSYHFNLLIILNALHPTKCSGTAKSAETALSSWFGVCYTFLKKSLANIMEQWRKEYQHRRKQCWSNFLETLPMDYEGHHFVSNKLWSVGIHHCTFLTTMSS